MARFCLRCQYAPPNGDTGICPVCDEEPVQEFSRTEEYLRKASHADILGQTKGPEARERYLEREGILPPANHISRRKAA